jgi:DNA-binding MarR family transcriptional regulator/GNAT superfamily N-acetyltransferase
MPEPQAVAHVRAFNRTVAERIGALTDVFLGRGRPMAESRILWEIGTTDGLEVRQLRTRLGLDSGYTTRVLQSLSRQGLITTDPSPTEARVKAVRLTSKGKHERAELDRRSDAVAESFLAPLDERRRAELVSAMQTVERLLAASLVTVGVEDPTTPDAQWCIQHYFAELAVRFAQGFDPKQTRSADAYELVPPHGLLLVARLRERPVGCGALKFYAAAPPDIKRMWVSPETRGLGVGQRLLHALEDQARAAGARSVRLETNRALTEAISMYRKSGYAEVAAFNDEPYGDYWFEKSLVRR